MQDRFEELAAPFPPDLVKQRRGNFGQQLDYVEAGTVIHRLNSVLADDWSFRVVEARYEADEVIVQAEMKVGDAVRQQFGGSRITRHRDTGEILNLADDLKAATSDALKKCAVLFGVAGYLYGDNGSGQGNDGHASRSNSHTDTGSSRSNGYANGTGRSQSRHNAQPSRNGQPNEPPASARQQSYRVSNDQIARIVQAARDIGMPQKDLITLARDTFGTTLSQLRPEQADDLISLISTAA